ncbi:MAG: Exopolysaccharide biosynthesis protein [uncultured Thiotrichaceae bacterium]|uniref:Exopolysaccharide biosynthesis protein n=1 Tax=uncultured Thiotrichaceae bacterium TaxID=298394 RepID=A0A6S6TGF4_9GAMM|nr:MAG: Exopolysaccharide biosynthesis protein [uncultured Thiotrichaceae bacterium]
MTAQPVYIFAPVSEEAILRLVMKKTGLMFTINDYGLENWSVRDHVCYFKYARLGKLQRLVLDEARAQGADVNELFAYFEAHFGQIEVDLLEPAHLLQMDVKFPGTVRYSEVLRRGVDVISALFGLSLFIVPGVIVALMIKLNSKGPVFFLQRRTGLYNHEFTIVKFRSMYTDAEKNGARWADRDDERITAVGRFIRKTRIDEVPQLWNVLTGDMSIIGPRPEREVFIRQLEQQVPFYRFRHLVKPGITGLAQVMFCYGASVEDARQKHRYDLYYIKHQNWKLDLKILRDTLMTTIKGTGV